MGWLPVRRMQMRMCFCIIYLLIELLFVGNTCRGRLLIKLSLEIKF